MGETVVINIEANTSGLQPTIDALTKIGVIEKKVAEEFKAANDRSVKSLEDSTKKVAKGFEEVAKAVKNVKVDNEVAKNLDLSTPVVKTANAAKTLRQEYKEAANEAGRLSKEFGENSEEAVRAQRNAAKLKDTIGDLNTRINSLNPDAKFRALSSLGFSLQGIFYTATGTLQAFGIESEKLDEVARNFQGFLGALTGLNQLTDVKDNIKNLAASLGITKGAFSAAANAGKEVTESFAKGVIGATNYKDSVTTLNQSWSSYKTTLEVVDKVKKGQATLQVAETALTDKQIAQNAAITETKTAELAAREANAVATTEEALASNAAAAAKAAEIEATGGAIVAKEGEIAVTEQATKSQTRFNIAAYANPYVLLGVALVGLVGALVYFSDSTDEAAEAQEKLNKAIRDITLEANAGIEKEIVQLNLLIDKYKDKETTDKQRLEIVKKLNDVAPETVSWFDKEGKAAVDLTSKTKDLIDAKLKQAQADAFIAEIARLNTENAKIQSRTLEESISGYDKFLAGAKAIFSGANAGIQFVFNKTTAAIDNNKSALDKNNKLIDAYKEKITQLGDAIFQTTQETDDLTKVDPFDKAIENSDKYYKQLRIEAANKAKDDEDYSRMSEYINFIELENKLKIYKKFNKDSKDLELQLAEESLKTRQKFLQYELEDLQKSQKQREEVAKQNASSSEEFQDGEYARTYQNLQEQILLYQKYGEDVTELQSKLDDLILQRRKSPGQKDKEDYENALGIIDQYYNSIELNILQTSKTRQDADRELAKIEIEKLEEQIKAGEKFGQNVDELRKKLAELKFADVIESKKKDIEGQIADLIKNAALDQITNAIAKNFQNQIDTINEIKEQQLENIDEEEQALKDSYDRRQISKRELEQQQKKYAQDRLDAERKAELEIVKIKQKQAIYDKATKIFEIGINTAKNAIEQPGPAGVLVPYWIALGAAQSAIVLATPIPKYKKGTLSVPGHGTEDSVYAMLQPGEAVIPTETNRKYSTAIKAIYENRISAEDINRFVKYKLENGNKVATETGSMSARFETADLYALGRIIKKNDSVYVKNLKDLAFMFEKNNRR